jgi:hypothetical protein
LKHYGITLTIFTYAVMLGKSFGYNLFLYLWFFCLYDYLYVLCLFGDRWGQLDWVGDFFFKILIKTEYQFVESKWIKFLFLYEKPIINKILPPSNHQYHFPLFLPLTNPQYLPSSNPLQMAKK